MIEASHKSGVKKPIAIVPHALDTAKYQRSYPTLGKLKPSKEKGEFVFYFIGELTKRKGIATLLKAFHLEFDSSESVKLVIKTSKYGISPKAIENEVII
jgi:glycosyltransferase involved in cell wall biosynthesis